MKNILYIHGYHGSSHGSSFTKINKYLDPTKFTLLGIDYETTNASVAISEIENFIVANDIQIAIASSLGAFLLLATKSNIRKIVINPCLAPTVELPKISTGDIDIDSYKEIEDAMIEFEKNKDLKTFDFSNVIGYFAKDDELFGQRYFEWWKMLTDKPINLVTGGHHVSNDAAKVVTNI